MEPAAHDDVSIGPLADEVRHLAFLVGTWHGTGTGGYPTMDPFEYGEELTFDHVGDAFLTYVQRSWLLADGSPLHFERGFLRPGQAADELELTLGHPLGLTEVSEGRIDGSEITLSTTNVGRTATGMPLVGLVRRYRVDGDTMRYELDMATEATPLTRHLAGELGRVT
jgi:THAP4-like, heme-binding beta-barrel domain